MKNYYDASIAFLNSWVENQKEGTFSSEIETYRAISRLQFEMLVALQEAHLLPYRTLDQKSAIGRLFEMAVTRTIKDWYAGNKEDVNFMLLNHKQGISLLEKLAKDLETRLDYETELLTNRTGLHNLAGAGNKRESVLE
jgi:hypothetical protein